MKAPLLIPQPQQLTLTTGTFRLPVEGTIGISDQELRPTAERARRLFRRSTIGVTVPRVTDTLRFGLNPALEAGGYTLTIAPDGVVVHGRDAAAVFHGLQTLLQIVAQAAGGRLPCLTVRDWPAFADRGLYYDLARGRVPRLAQLLAMAEGLAAAKINQLQLYIEHTFAFRGHPSIGRDASPLSAEDILALDARCRELHIELVPSLASFGHLASVLCHPEYHSLAEDWGVGRYADPEVEKLQPWMRHKAWSLAPANPAIYDFLDSLFAEFLPLFSSKRFNVCCDETWDLCMGQSYELAKREGKGNVYLGHILKLRELSARHGKSIMFWGDIIRHYPDLIARIPKDVLVLDWGYASNHPFDRIGDFRQAGVPFYACPGTSSWVSLFPRLPEARANIAGFTAAARKHGAQGVLNTDWGDGGHYNFMEYSWHGYLFGAEQAWNPDADAASFTRRFARVFLGADKTDLIRAIDTLGDVSHTWVHPYYQSVWQHVFFAAPGDTPLAQQQPENGSVVDGDTIRAAAVRLDAALGRATLKRLAPVRATLARYAGARGVDPMGVLPYWVFAVDTIAHAARKLTVLGPGGTDTPAARRGLKREMTDLMKRFQKLWLARNQPSEIRFTLARYRRVLAALR